MPEELDFLKELQPDASKDVLNESLAGAPEKENEEPEQRPHNRQARRENKQLQWEREQRIRLEAKLEAMSEASKFAQETGVDERLARLYGTDNKEAIALHQAMREDDRRLAKEEALQELRAEQAREAAAVKEYEAKIDAEFENIEDEYDVDLTSNAPAAKKARNDLIAMVQKLSPKDEHGNVKEYADFSAAWDVLQSQKEKKDNSRNKDIASRGTQASSEADTSKLAEDRTRAYLRSQGINV